MNAPVPHVLFLCTQNACRSQMAEGWLRHLSGGRVRVDSAGVQPGVLSPKSVTAMAEVGIDISGHHSKHPDDLAGAHLTHVVTVCDRAADECPTYPGEVIRMHWSVPDPADMADLVQDFPHLVGDGFRAVRDNLRDRVVLLLMDMGVAVVDAAPGNGNGAQSG